MNKFLKLLMAFAVLGFVACTTDATDDLAVNVSGVSGSKMVTRTLGVTLDGSTRLELGDKTAEGKYPVKWTAGDVLGVNGLPSSGAVVAEGNPSMASFDFKVAADTVEYHIVYPYIEDAVGTEPHYSVVSFAAEQYYTEGTFDPASFPLGGYAKGTKVVDEDTGETILTQPELTGLKLNYLAGILRFEMTAEEAVTLTKLEMRSTFGKLSGLFDTNCASAGLAAQSTASDSMSYIFADGLELTPGSTKVFYVAIPKGTGHKSIRIKFCTTDPTVGMIAGFATDEVKAGVVKEFNTVTFKNNLAEYEDTIFEIKDEATLEEFAIKATKGLLAYAEVNVTANVAVSAEAAAAWTPIENFRGVLNGGDYTISGLTKPLFGTLRGKVTNLTVDSNVVSDVENATAILARCIGSGAEVAFVTTKGSVKHTLATSDYNVFAYVAGFAGYTSGSTSIHDCTNLANVTMELDQNDNKEKGTYAAGFLACHTGEVAEPASTFYNNTNGSASDSTLGSVTVKGSYPQASTLYVGGIISRLGQVTVQASNLTNYGKIDVDVTKLPNYTNLGGVIGYIKQVDDADVATADKANIVHSCFKNYGKINVKYEGASGFRAAGVVGYATWCTMDDLQNMEGADVTVNSVSAGGYVAGVIGCTDNTAISNVENRGNVYALIDASNWKSSAVSQVGGCVANASTDADLDTATNYGTATLAEGSKGYRALVAGCLAYQSGGVAKNLTNHASGAVVNNAETTNYMGAGGCVGYGTGNGLDNTDNAASVTVGGKCGQNLYVGGCVALTDTPMGSGNTNTGAVYSANNTAAEIFVGGIVGRLYTSASYDSTITDSSNNGSVTVRGTAGATSYAYIGGCIGKFENNKENYELTNVNNLANGAVLVEQLANPYPQYIGGVIGQSATKALVVKNCNNSASVSTKDCEGAEVSNNHFNLGGVLGYNAATVTIDNCRNTGAIYASRSLGAQNPSVAGIHGRAGVAFTIKNCTNSGAVELASSHSGWCMVAGITGAYGGAATVQDCSNSGNITYSGTIGKNKVPYIAGCIASLLTAGYNVSNVTNTGVVSLTGDATKATGETAIGGIIGKITSAGTFSGTLKSGARIPNYDGDDEPYTTNVVVSGSFGPLHAGGIIGHIGTASGNSVDFTNVKICVYGKVELTSTAKGTTANLGGVTGKHTVKSGTSISEYSDLDIRTGLPLNYSTQVTTVNIQEQYN